MKSTSISGHYLSSYAIVNFRLGTFSIENTYQFYGTVVDFTN